MVKDARSHVQKFTTEDKRALRDGFGEGMMILGEKNAQVVALCADLTESDRLDKFRDKYPNRFVEVGVAEQNLVGVAAGMAHVGKIPYAASFAVFCPGRSWDQVRVSVCYSGANVKIYGGHAGITVGEDGATHQALEDVAIMRALPRMTVIVPADGIEMRKATLASAELKGPAYLRGGRAKQAQITTDTTPFAIGEANLLSEGKDATIIACGILVREAMLAAAQLEKQKVKVRVLNMHTIKPLDVDAVIKAAYETGAIVTAEEHQINGGLGSAVAEAVGEHFPVPMERVGVSDTFGESGDADALLDAYGLRAENIVAAVKRTIERKKSRGSMKEFKLSKGDAQRLEKVHAGMVKAAKPKKSAAPAKKVGKKKK